MQLQDSELFKRFQFKQVNHAEPQELHFCFILHFTWLERLYLIGLFFGDLRVQTLMKKRIDVIKM